MKMYPFNFALMVLGTYGAISVVNGKLFLANFEQRLKHTHIQKCISDMNSSKLVTNAERTEKLHVKL